MKRIFALIAALLALPGAALACQPCQETWNFEKTAAQADLVIVGERAIIHDRENRESFGPPFVNIRVEQVLKGAEDDDVITVKSWSGMCDYGIYFKEGRRVIFLSDASQGHTDKTSGFSIGNVQYDSVNMGCAQKTLPVEDGMVEIEGEKLSLDDFKARYLSGE